MAISFDQINRVVLRQVFLPWFRRMMADLGVTISPDWNPSDEELDRLAGKVADAFREAEDE